MGGEEGVAIGVDVLCCLADVAAAPNVTAEGEPVVFDGEDRGDFDNGDMDLLGRMSSEVESVRSFNGLTA